MDATSTEKPHLQNAPIDSGTGAVARFLGKLYPSLVRPHACSDVQIRMDLGSAGVIRFADR